MTSSSIRLPGFAVRRCLHTRHVSASCNTCIKVCPREALSIREQRLVLAPNRCSGCGACSSVCPQDALLPPTPAPSEAEEALQKIREAAQSGKVYFAERDAALLKDAAGSPISAIRVPALESVSVAWLLQCVVLGAKDVTLLAATADTHRPTLTQRIVLVRRVLAEFGYEASIQVRLSSALQSAGRRMWLRDLAHRMEDEAPRAGLSAEKIRALREEPAVRVPKNHQLLLDALIKLRRRAPQNAPATPVAASLLPKLTIDALRCVHCGLCAVVCPTGALESTPVSQSNKLTLDPLKCTGCHLCADICFAHAIALRPATTLEETLDRAPHAVGVTENVVEATAPNAFAEWEDKLGTMIDAPIYRT